MKLCKACNHPISPKLDPRALYCNKSVCVKARKALGKLRYKKTPTSNKRDERCNWICKCSEWCVVPAQFNRCADCKARPREGKIKKERVFFPKIHAVRVEDFINEYYNKQDAICQKFKV